MKLSQKSKILMKKGYVKKELLEDELLKKYGVKEIYSFDEINIDMPKENYNDEKKLRLIIMPFYQFVVDDCEITKEYVKQRCDLKILENYFISSIELKYAENTILSKPVVTNSYLTKYYKDLNLIIFYGNPFFDEKINGVFKEDLRQISEITEIKYIDAEEKEIQRMVDNIKSSLEEKHNSYEQKIEVAQYDMIYLERMIMQKKLWIKESQEILKVLNNKMKNSLKTFTSQIKELKKNKLIKEVKINNYGLNITFPNICINGQVNVKMIKNSKGVEIPKLETRKIELGDLTIQTDLTGTIKVVGRANTETGYIHPHATTAGDICLGAIREEVFDTLDEGNLIKFARLMYSWCRSYNESDSYKKLQSFYDYKRNKMVRGEKNEDS